MFYDYRSQLYRVKSQRWFFSKRLETAERDAKKSKKREEKAKKKLEEIKADKETCDKALGSLELKHERCGDAVKSLQRSTDILENHLTVCKGELEHYKITAEQEEVNFYTIK